jgi:peptidoglycan/xylan/chitin deacetylase (PgdA/CDA1 family)
MKRRYLILILALAVVAGGAAVFLKTAYVVPVIMYHSIDHKDKETKLSVSPESFERQMEFLHKHRYNVVGLDKIISYIQKKGEVPPRTIAITFDDGLYNNYQYAYPVLKRYGIPATIFIITSKIGTPGYLGWDDLKEMARSGLITIGSHTVSHKWLPTTGTRQLEDELKRSKDILRQGLGVEVKTFCYPIGAHNDRVKAKVKEAGYACAVTTNPGHSAPAGDIYAIKRIKISRTSDNLFVFWFETSGYYTWLKEHRDE